MGHHFLQDGIAIDTLPLRASINAEPVAERADRDTERTGGRAHGHNLAIVEKNRLLLDWYECVPWFIYPSSPS